MKDLIIRHEDISMVTYEQHGALVSISLKKGAEVISICVGESSTCRYRNDSGKYCIHSYQNIKSRSINKLKKGVAYVAINNMYPEYTRVIGLDAGLFLNNECYKGFNLSSNRLGIEEGSLKVLKILSK